MIDLYYQHRVDPNTPIEDTVGAMAGLISPARSVSSACPKPHPTRSDAPSGCRLTLFRAGHADDQSVTDLIGSFRPGKMLDLDQPLDPFTANNRIVEIKSSLILQPGPAALTDGLDAVLAALAGQTDRALPRIPWSACLLHPTPAVGPGPVKGAAGDPGVSFRAKFDSPERLRDTPLVR